MRRKDRQHNSIPWFILAIIIFVWPVHPRQVNAQSNLDIVEISTNDVVRFIQQDKGRVILVMLYESTCPACRRFFPELLKLAGSYMYREVDVLALSLDDTKGRVMEYLSEYDLTIVPLWLLPGLKGELAKGLATIGITYDSLIPFVAVLDKRGRVVYQGRASIQSLTNAINESLRS